MTTRVTIDAHAGWPVLVTTRHGEPAAAKSISTQRVEPHTQRDFYLHSGMSIINIEECSEQKPEPKPMENER